MTTKIEAPEFLTLPEVASFLGLHRATVNDMVLSRRLPARRRRGHWYVEQSDLERFAATYQRPPNAPQPRDHRLVSEGGWTILSCLVDWDEATTAELDRVVDLHIGNIRKQLNLLSAAHLADKTDDCFWVATDEGREVDLIKRSTSHPWSEAS
jgi:excisionase family DNA binding protein